MKMNNSNQELSIKCGKTTDSIEVLKALCGKEAGRLCETLHVAQGEAVEVPFWTSDFPELICVGRFSKSDERVTYELDYSESTL